MTEKNATALAEPDTRGARHDAPPMARRGRVGIVVMLIVSLLLSAATRYWADEKRQAAIPNRGETGAGTSLSSMNSFALGLMLGGLRGPLVMVLWTNSESQKSARDLEGVDTQIEWIRLLQPEFDTVHIFQIWNKAYNISVQMASLANKYSVILDALDYGKKVDAEKPEDINILSAIGQLYFEKFGNSTEKYYYRRRVRQESLPHPQAHRQFAGSRRTLADAILDDQFNILANLLRPATDRQPGTDSAREYNDGSDLQYLKKYEPYPDGVSPYAMAYNYDKRAEVLMNVGKQRHAQLSDLVIDSRPALALKNWAEEEWEQGRRRELEAFGFAVIDDRLAIELPTADLAPDAPITNEAITDDLNKKYEYLPARTRREAARLALVAYNRVPTLVTDALAEYIRHLSNDTTNEGNYRSHMDELVADAQLAAADRDYLAAQLAEPGTRGASLTSAKQHYLESIHLFEIVVLKYYTDQTLLEASLPPGYGRYRTADRKGIEDLTAQQSEAAMATMLAVRQTRHATDSHSEDQQDYLQHIARAQIRLQHLKAVGN